MLIEFKVKNFLSFKEEAVLSMIASSITENKENVLPEKQGFKLLKSAVIYGANSSGKSNLFGAMYFMRWFVINSSKESQVGEKIPAEPFRLSPPTDHLGLLHNAPSSFEITFIQDGIPFRYGFSTTQSEIVEEWLFYRPKTKEIRLFERKGSTINIHSSRFKEGKGLENKDQERTRANALFLSVVAQWNGALSKGVIAWFQSLAIISAKDDSGYMDASLNMLQDEQHKTRTLGLLQSMGINIDELTPKLIKGDTIKMPQNIPDELRKKVLENVFLRLQVTKKRFDQDGKEAGSISWDFDIESEGTKKLIGLSGPIFNALDQKRVLVIDEFDTRLHALMSRALISLFHSTHTNQDSAQLIIATHDTNLLSGDLFRRDQIWFIEKDRVEASNLYSLVEYKGENGRSIRKDAEYEKNYIAGKYGAIPYINTDNLSSLLAE